MGTGEVELAAILRERGMRVTSQRLVIHRTLRERGGHLSSEQVHAAVASALPGISPQTVYSTLQLLADLGVARRVPITAGSTRFETRLDDHHHVICERCGEIADLEVNVPLDEALAAARRGGFAPGFAALSVMGRCSRCTGSDAG